jgi:hypothetical protein
MAYLFFHFGLFYSYGVKTRTILYFFLKKKEVCWCVRSLRMLQATRAEDLGGRNCLSWRF